MENRLFTEAATIHWHGVFQRWTTWQDGAAYVTQYPIMPRQTFTYRFLADPAGTHWYHSHFKNQKDNGLFGLLVVYPAVPETPYFLVTMGDWFHHTSTDTEITHPFAVDIEELGTGEFLVGYSYRDYSVDGIETNAFNFESGLINGRGRYGNNTSPLAIFTVNSNVTYRFRIVNAGSEMGLDISIDNHSITLVAVDGSEISPLIVDSFIVQMGERTDFEVSMTQPVDNYWIRARTLRAGINNSTVPNPQPGNHIQEINAILR